jgi:hypothetical protein
MNENDLINKLMISKKIMERHQTIPRGNSETGSLNQPSVQVENYQAPAAKYNLPEELMVESQPKPRINSGEPPSRDRILNSKLPDEIKRLMIEHPIAQPVQKGPSLSNELVDKAARLMNSDASGKQLKESVTRVQSSPSVDKNELKNLIKETMSEILEENGLLVESVNNTGELFSFRVGKHIFEGKVHKIKKVK